MVISVNANAPGYWESVRKNATRRRALEAVKGRLKTVRGSQIYEQYLEDHLSLVQSAALTEDLHNDLEQYNEFKRECANVMGLPELAECDETEIYHGAREAVREAQQALYGEYDDDDNDHDFCEDDYECYRVSWMPSNFIVAIEKTTCIHLYAGLHDGSSAPQGVVPAWVGPAYSLVQKGKTPADLAGSEWTAYADPEGFVGCSHL